MTRLVPSVRPSPLALTTGTPAFTSDFLARYFADPGADRSGNGHHKRFVLVGRDAYPEIRLLDGASLGQRIEPFVHLGVGKIQRAGHGFGDVLTRARCDVMTREHLA